MRRPKPTLSNTVLCGKQCVVLEHHAHVALGRGYAGHVAPTQPHPAGGRGRNRPAMIMQAWSSCRSPTGRAGSEIRSRATSMSIGPTAVVAAVPLDDAVEGQDAGSVRCRRRSAAEHLLVPPLPVAVAVGELRHVVEAPGCSLPEASQIGLAVSAASCRSAGRFASPPCWWADSRVRREKAICFSASSVSLTKASRQRDALGRSVGDDAGVVDPGHAAFLGHDELDRRASGLGLLGARAESSGAIQTSSATATAVWCARRCW